MNKSIIHYNKALTTNKKFFLLFATIFLALLPDLAMAQIPELTTGTVGIPGVDENTSIMKTLGMTIGFIVFILVLATLGFGLGDTIASFFRQLNDARKEGDWSPLIKFIGLSFAILAIVFALMDFINKYVLATVNAL